MAELQRQLSVRRLLQTIVYGVQIIKTIKIVRFLLYSVIITCLQFHLVKSGSRLLDISHKVYRGVPVPLQHPFIFPRLTRCPAATTESEHILSCFTIIVRHRIVSHLHTGVILPYRSIPSCSRSKDTHRVAYFRCPLHSVFASRKSQN